jgi:antirestriction protein ArdC
MTEPRADVYSRITHQIAAAIEAGTTDWHMPWHHPGYSVARPINVASAKPYRGINILALRVAAAAGYTHGLWGTYRQWLAEGAQVRKDTRGSTVVLWKQVADSSDDEQGNDDDTPGSRIIARAFTVFNVAQVDGYRVETAQLRPEPERFADADAFIPNLGIRTIYGGVAAYYLPGKDEVHLPDPCQFGGAADFYGTAVHEYGHATGAKHRLARDTTGRFGSEKYAAEDCVAEMTAGFIMANLGIAHHPRPDHAAYISVWLKTIKTDTRAIFTAASKAQHAADWMHAQQRSPQT